MRILFTIIFKCAGRHRSFELLSCHIQMNVGKTSKAPFTATTAATTTTVFTFSLALSAAAASLDRLCCFAVPLRIIIMKIFSVKQMKLNMNPPYRGREKENRQAQQEIKNQLPNINRDDDDDWRRSLFISL
jgi:hypothetical protein